MTQPHEVTVSDAEVKQVAATVWAEAPDDVVRQALAAFLAARVPGAVADQGDDSYPSFGVWEAGHNALRAAVLRGPG